jgi:hypothetical protein
MTSRQHQESRLTLRDFVAESNRIEAIGIVLAREIEAHKALLDLPEIRVPELECFVRDVAGRPLRDRPGMNVMVGPHKPPEGGVQIRDALVDLLADIHSLELTPWEAHVAYESLHPFMDGNGRSGRALWAWQIKQEGRDPFALPFLHASYYEALNVGREL